MDAATYYTVLIICLLANSGMFVLVWVEIRGQRKLAHDRAKQVMDIYAGIVRVLLDHEARISVFEGNPHMKPAAIYDKLGGTFDDLVRDRMRELKVTGSS